MYWSWSSLKKLSFGSLLFYLCKLAFRQISCTLFSSRNRPLLPVISFSSTIAGQHLFITSHYNAATLIWTMARPIHCLLSKKYALFQKRQEKWFCLTFDIRSWSMKWTMDNTTIKCILLTEVSAHSTTTRLDQRGTMPKWRSSGNILCT